MHIAIRYFRISSLNSLSQLIHTLTTPILNPINRMLGLKYQASIKYDWVAFVLLILVEFLKMICISLLLFHGIMPIAYLLIYVLSDLIIQPCDILFYAILIRVIMSFVNPQWQHPLASFLRIITEPLLKLGRKIIPVISGFDFSPFIILVCLKLITIFISYSLPWRIL